ncbi:diguanylate cyclase [Clostridium pascui]|uniref:GGDEF domain-containing protein n=1 Tax=Clostridium pascui TaxID=46609 RepID=UPI001959BD5C|nr:diguanylate cyclase [Clostridium pascui]MBM7868727.1 diguanylate cyclase [Clostridium pascui]
MITELFINSCILIAFISISQNFVMKKDINKNSSIALKILTGTYAGLLGILLMLFSIRVTPSIITDFRALPILLSAIYGGFLPTIIASLIMGAFRILYFGISNASLIALIVILLMGSGFSTINLVKSEMKGKWIYSITYSLLVNTIAMPILIKDSMLLFKVFTVYCVSTLLMSYFIFKFTEYLSESVQSYRRLKSEATIDFLTGLNNVRQFDNMFNIVAQQTIRNGEELSLLFLDIDYFKKINDTFGHSSGDMILKDLAVILSNTCRVYDVISRNGGEEFSVLLANCPAAHALEVAERIRKNVEGNKFYISNKVNINITVSLGISTYPNITSNIDNLLEHADTALYEAKKTGRNKVVLYNSKDQLTNVN